MSPDEIKDINDRIKTGGASDRETQQAEKPAAEADTTIHGEAPPIEPAVTISPDKLRQIDQRIKTGGASDRETPQTATQTQPPATEAPTETPVSTIPAEQATPADQPQVFGEVPSLPDAGQSPVEQLPTVQSVEKPAAAADTQPNKFTQGNENNQEKAAELKQQAKQNLEARLVETGASEANKTKVLEEFDKDPAAVLNAEQSVKNIIANPNAETNKPNEEIQTGSAQKPEQQEINIEQKRKEALGEVVYKMSEYNITPDKQANVLAMLSANPDMLIDTASVINNLQIEKKEDMDPQAQMHEAIKKRIQELKDKIDPDKKGVNNLTDDEKKQLKALNLLNDALSKETDEFTKSQLLLLLFAAVIAGTLEGLKEGIEQSAKL